MMRKFHDNLFYYTIAILVFVFHFSIIIIPSIRSIFSSFTDWSGLGVQKYNGIQNYLLLFSDRIFWNAIFHNIIWMLFFLTIPISMGLVIGFIISSVHKGKIIYRTIYFLPYVISAAIAGKIFSTLYNPYFGFNNIFQSLGWTFLERDWMSPQNALISVALVDNWHWWGFVLVIVMTALQQIDISLYEAASAEGASSLQKFFYVTIPLVKDTLIFIILITIIWSFLTFDYVWIMTRGGPGTEILSTYLYKNAFLKYQAGYASAIAVTQSLLSLMTFLVFLGLRMLGKRNE